MDDLHVVELREYTLHPGKRDTLIELFDRNFLEPQEALGIRLLGQFRDLDRPDRFVWLRAFPSMEARAPALASFYGGPVWKEHRNAANATMIDSDNVLLLKPAWGGALQLLQRPEHPGSGSELALTVCSLRSAEALNDFVRVFHEDVKPALEKSGIPVLAVLDTERAANNFPALPLREGEHTLVWMTPLLERGRFDPSHFTEALGAHRELLARTPQHLRLEPTRGSRFGGAAARPAAR